MHYDDPATTAKKLSIQDFTGELFRIKNIASHMTEYLQAQFPHLAPVALLPHFEKAIREANVATGPNTTSEAPSSSPKQS